MINCSQIKMTKPIFSKHWKTNSFNLPTNQICNYLAKVANLQNLSLILEINYLYTLSKKQVLQNLKQLLAFTANIHSANKT